MFVSHPAANQYPLSLSSNKTLFCTEGSRIGLSLKAVCGGYISARNDGATISTAEKAKGWEEFVFTQMDDSVSLRSHHGTYLGVDLATQRIIQTTNVPPVGQRLLFVAAEYVQLETEDGDVLSMTGSHPFRLSHHESGSGNENEGILFLERNGSGFFNLKSACHGYICALRDHQLTAVSHASAWENFDVQPREDGSISIRTHHGTFLSVSDTKTLVQQSASPEGNQKLFLRHSTQRSTRPFLGAQLFVPGREEERALFLDQTPVLEVSKTEIYGFPAIIKTYTVNTVLGPDSDPVSPVVHSYNFPIVIAPVLVKLPRAFAENLPEAIRDQLVQHDVRELDIYFTPQPSPMQFDDEIPSLKPASWMFPGRPKLRDIHGNPAEYNKQVWMALFEAEHLMNGQVQSLMFNRFSATLHEGKISPNTGHLDLSRAPENTTHSFYSVVLFKEQKRAAVTLHVLLTDADFERLKAVSENVAHGHSHGLANNFATLLDAVNRGFGPANWVEKLRGLTRR